MPAERYYFPEMFQEGQEIILKDQEHHHLVHVMRTRLGEEIEIVNGMGQLGTATLESTDKKSAKLHLKSLYTSPAETKKLILAQGLPRQNRLEFIIEKCTELGMTEIWLFPASRSEKKELSANQVERLNTLSVAAMKQCGRLFLPKIVVMPPLKKWKDIDMETILFGDVATEAPTLLSVWKKLHSPTNVVFFIGPESGFTDEETTSMRSLGAEGVKLHTNILRTDTAAIASMALLSQLSI